MLAPTYDCGFPRSSQQVSANQARCIGVIHGRSKSVAKTTPPATASAPASTMGLSIPPIQSSGNLTSSSAERIKSPRASMNARFIPALLPRFASKRCRTEMPSLLNDPATRDVSSVDPLSITINSQSKPTGTATCRKESSVAARCSARLRVTMTMLAFIKASRQYAASNSDQTLQTRHKCPNWIFGHHRKQALFGGFRHR